MTSAFTLVGGAADKIRQKLTTTGATIVAGNATYPTGVVWFQCNEIAGGTPLLTIEVYDAQTLTSYYLSSEGVTYKAKALTALQGVTFDLGILLNPNEFLRITSSVANQIDVVGLALLGQNLS